MLFFGCKISVESCSWHPSSSGVAPQGLSKSAVDLPWQQSSVSQASYSSVFKKALRCWGDALALAHQAEVSSPHLLAMRTECSHAPLHVFGINRGERKHLPAPRQHWGGRPGTAGCVLGGGQHTPVLLRHPLGSASHLSPPFHACCNAVGWNHSSPSFYWQKIRMFVRKHRRHAVTRGGTVGLCRRCWVPSPGHSKQRRPNCPRLPCSQPKAPMGPWQVPF